MRPWHVTKMTFTIMIFLQHLHNTSLMVRNTSGTPKQRGHMKHAAVMSQNNQGHRKQGKSETLAQPKGASMQQNKRETITWYLAWDPVVENTLD